MITFLKEPFKDSESFKTLDSDLLSWFKKKYKSLSPPQKFSVKLISDRENVLISSPTGTGKTLSAFLSVINHLVKKSKESKLEDRVYAIYISPLRALGNDIEKNLEIPLKELMSILKDKGLESDIRHGVRTGDTTSYVKQKMNVKPPHILITTPESLAIALAAPKFKEKISKVEYVIVDEIHSLAENKRGVDLALSLERLTYLAKDFVRIGLSATVAPLDEIAKYLVGTNRNCKVVDVSYVKKYSLIATAPEKDPLKTTAADGYVALYDKICSIVNKNRTTLIFTNTRSGTESVVMNLKNRYKDSWAVDKEIVAHHSSLSREQRLKVEESLKMDDVRVVVSSTSLELGIDIGSIDAVIQIGSPKSIARCLQRVGRAGHNLGLITKGYFICPDYDDLVEVAVMLQDSYNNKIDRVNIPEKSMDMLSQHIFGMSLEKVWSVDEALDLLRRAYQYRNLTKEDLISVLHFLSGHGDLQKAGVYGKIWFDNNSFGKKGKLARVMYMSNIGSIPDETKISVKCEKDVIGYVEESFLENLRKGDIFALGGRNYIFKSAAGMTIRADKAFDRKATVPSWFSEQLPLSFDLSKSIRAFKAKIINMFIEKSSDKDILKAISDMPVDRDAANIIFQYMKKHYYYLKTLTNIEFNENTWIIENYHSSEGYKIIFHTLYGRRVNDALSRIVAWLIGKSAKKNIAISVSDNGFMLHMPKAINFNIDILDNIDVDETLKYAVENTEILRRRFRHVASRGLMILKSYKGVRKTAGRQQVSATILMSLVKDDYDFPIMKETYREIFENYLDIKHLKEVINIFRNREANIINIAVDVPSPFAHNLVISGSSDVVLANSKKELLREFYSRIDLKIAKKD
jgi:ATP-dependent Lhr-like helicase